MQETGIGRSRDGLIKFLDFTAEKGLMNKGTVGTRKKACATILSILDETEAADLSKINLEDVIQRHSILTAGKFVPATLKGYQGHLRGSIKDFLDFAKNPSTWRPTAQKRVSKAAPAPSAKKPEEIKYREVTTSQPSIHIDFHIHISPELDPTQIDKIFESMRNHFGRSMGE